MNDPRSSEEIALDIDARSDKQRIALMLDETHAMMIREPLVNAFTAAGFVSRLVGWFYTTLSSEKARLQFEQLIEYEFTMAHAYVKEHPDD